MIPKVPWHQELPFDARVLLYGPSPRSWIIDVQCINRYNSGTGITTTLFDLIQLSRHILMQDHPSSSTLPSDTNDSETWKVYWKEQVQPWRTEPAIDEERQQQL